MFSLTSTYDLHDDTIDVALSTSQQPQIVSSGVMEPNGSKEPKMGSKSKQWVRDGILPELDKISIMFSPTVTYDLHDDIVDVAIDTPRQLVSRLIQSTSKRSFYPICLHNTWKSI